MTLTAGRGNECIDWQIAQVHVAVLPIGDVKTEWNSTVELLELAYRFREFTHEWLKNAKYSDYRPFCTTQDEWSVVKYVMDVLRSFRYWTLCMLKRHLWTLHNVITVYNVRFDHMDVIMQAVVPKRTQWKENLYCAVKVACQMVSKYYTEVTPTTGMLLISANILKPFRKLWSFRKCDTEFDINSKVKTSYTSQYTSELGANKSEF